MSDLLNNLSGLSTFVIGTAFVLHVAAFAVLRGWARRDLRVIASSLDDFTRGLKHRSVLGATAHLSDQVEAFLADVNEVLEHAERRGERASLRERINILDEKRHYLHSLGFETAYNLCRTMIEAYPLAGVLGTILAIGAALQVETGAGQNAAVGVIVGRFGDAIWSTFAGLTAAIFLMFLNSLLEPSISRLSENRAHVRDTVARVKRELSFSGTASDDTAAAAS